ncbi:hypothetical protein CYLTODRAFT_494102 [Cylindrobasidium torrendii FP15055 ss-10]|uniref:Glucose receptor Git3 N-terminal domain-containing protein n=1 Tax=Cylindrobasidium torrendii FP15055 ss-10 TaxID=1314674 RepID=A0A0D7AXW6_9AGAR|nr:hypothetical protein CYLTODRAFT_494102 [Cylindrobasidium torrendii FP15055 ss-10]
MKIDPLSGNITQTIDEYRRGFVCDANDFELQHSLAPASSTVTCLSRGDSIGLTVAVEAGFLSLLSVGWVFFLILRNIVRYTRLMRSKLRFTYIYELVQDPVDIFLLSLFTADFFQALAAVMDVKWIHEGVVRAGPVCTAQGVISTLGETGVAITTLLIAVYTFLLYRTPGGASGKGDRASLIIAGALVALTWAFVTVMIVVGRQISEKSHPEIPYFEPSPYWCWIGNHRHNLVYKIIGEYAWMWLNLVGSIVMYSILALSSHGNIQFHDDSWWAMSFSLKPKAVNGDDSKTKLVLPTVRTMLAYPFWYSVTVLPPSVVRWATFVNPNVFGESRRGAVSLAAITVFRLSGLINVGLLLRTRPRTVLFGSRDDIGGKKKKEGKESTIQKLGAGQSDGREDTDGPDIPLARRSDGGVPGPRRPESSLFSFNSDSPMNHGITEV